MAFVTRFNPTANGPLHAGHIYMAMMNEAIAHDSGGRFLVRFDDSNPFHLTPIGRERMDAIVAGQRYDLEWLGIPVDEWSKQSETVEQIITTINQSLGAEKLPPEEIAESQLCDLLGREYMQLYPYAPRLTAEKVIWDAQAGVNLLVRGIDLITEFSLYQHFCYRFSVSVPPRHIYLPRLMGSQGDIRKSLGGQSIADLRAAGYSSKQVRDKIEKACLRYPPDGWTLRNLNPEPTL